MTFLIVFITLLIDRLNGGPRPVKVAAWMTEYCRWMAGSSKAQWLFSHRWNATLVLVPPLLLVALLQWLAADIGWLVALGFGVFVLLMSIGPGDLADETEAFIEARDSGDTALATQRAQRICLTQVSDSEPRRSVAVARAVVVLANRRLVAPLFWFVVLGPVGAAAYRFIQLLAEQIDDETCPTGRQLQYARLRHLADWLPARVTAAGYAIAGDFDTVAQAWRDFEYEASAGGLDEADALLANTGLAALDTFPDDADELAGDAGIPPDDGLIPPVVEDAMALVWRGLAVWVIVIGGSSLVAAVT